MTAADVRQSIHDKDICLKAAEIAILETKLDYIETTVRDNDSCLKKMSAKLDDLILNKVERRTTDDLLRLPKRVEALEDRVDSITSVKWIDLLHFVWVVFALAVSANWWMPIIRGIHLAASK